MGQKLITGPPASIERWQVSFDADKCELIICLSCWRVVGLLSPEVKKIERIKLTISGKTLTLFPDVFPKGEMVCPHCGENDLAKLKPMKDEQ